MARKAKGYDAFHEDTEGAAIYPLTPAHERTPVVAQEERVPGVSGRSRKTMGLWRRYKWRIVLAIVVVIALAAAAYYFHLFGLGLSPQERMEREIASIVAAAGKHLILPQGETPALATVTDAAKLAADQPFFAHAHNGDQLLVFAQAAQAVLYSPSRDIIVSVGPIQAPPQGGVE